MNELRQRVAAAIPGADAALEVWRVATEDGDFLRTLRRLAGGGNATVMHRLGRMYAGGIGVARDDTEALGWFRKGAAAGNLNSTAMVAIALIEGRGAGKDPQEGVRLLRAAAEGAITEAMYRLGVLLVQGKVVDKDLAEAVRLLSRAGAAGSRAVDGGPRRDAPPGDRPEGQLRQGGTLVQAGGRSATRRHDVPGRSLRAGQGRRAQRCRRRPALSAGGRLGHPFGHHNYAAMLDRGKGVERDPEQAADHVLRALDLGNPFTYHADNSTPQGRTSGAPCSASCATPASSTGASTARSRLPRSRRWTRTSAAASPARPLEQPGGRPVASRGRSEV